MNKNFEKHTMTQIPISYCNIDELLPLSCKIGRNFLKDKVPIYLRSKIYMFIASREEQENYAIDVYFVKDIYSFVEKSKFTKKSINSYINSHKKWISHNCNTKLIPFMYIHINNKNIITKHVVVELIEYDENFKKNIENLKCIYNEMGEIRILGSTDGDNWVKIIFE